MRVSPDRLTRADVPGAAGAAVAVTAVSFVHGGYFAREWGWQLLAFALGALLALLGRDRLPRAPLEACAVASAAGLAAWALLSTAWSVGAAQPVLFFERSLVYVLALAAACLAVRRGAPLLAGVVAAAVVVCGYGLVARLAPGSVTTYPPPDGYQLEEPLGYWNAVAILATTAAVAAAVYAVEARDRIGRVAAAAALPVLATTLYLTFSRGGLAAALVGLCAAVALVRRRLHLLGLLVLLAPPTLAPSVYAARFAALTSAGRPLAETRTAGWHVSALLGLCTLLAAGAGAALPALERRIRPGRRTRRAVGATLVAAVVLALVAAVAAAGGPQAISSRIAASFTRSLPGNGGDLNRRLTSLSSDGRSDYWRVAWRETRAHPLLGGGAGSFERWWDRYRPTAYDARNAHNLYLETLAELGPVGLVLLLALVAAPFVAAARARSSPAAVAGASGFAAYAAHAALDWDFQIPAVTIAALFCAAAALVEARSGRELPITLPLRTALGALALVAALAAIALQVGNGALANARDALGRGDVAAAARLASRAHRWQPWSSEPLQILGEAELVRGDRAEARRDLLRALALDRGDWSIWADLAAASSGGERATATARARALNPYTR